MSPFVITSGSSNLAVGSPLLSLPNETLHEIGVRLVADPKNLTAFMLACRTTASVAEYIRYTSVVINGRSGRLLLNTFISGTAVSTRYCRLVKRMLCRGCDDDDDDNDRNNIFEVRQRERVKRFLQLNLLADTLRLLDNLASLWLDLSAVDPDYFISQLRSVGVIRDKSRPSRSVGSAMFDSTTNLSQLSLPNLRYLRISGQTPIATLASHRALTSLEISYMLNMEEFDALIAGAEGCILGTTLATLCITTVRSLRIDVVIPILSSTFSKLKHLCFSQPCMDPVVSFQISRSLGKG